MKRQQDKVIPVVFTPDDNFMYQTAVAILSIMDAKDVGTKYHFYLLVEKPLESYQKQYYEKIKIYHDDFLYTVTVVDFSCFEKVRINHSHISRSACYRLLISSIYDFDRCMYHDGDILVYDDLSEMFNVNMDNCYVAGVKAIINQQNFESNKKMISEWNFKSLSQYIFNGDMTMNLDMLRKDNVADFFLQEILKGYPQQDQDVINYCCYDHIAFLPLKYCMLNRWVNNNVLHEYSVKTYTEKEIIDAKKNPAIIHFCGDYVKPWINTRCSYAKEWWEFAKRILGRDEFVEMYSKALENTTKRDWKNVLNHFKDISGHIYIFAYTNNSIELVSHLIQNGIIIDGFVDNDYSKKGSMAYGVRVHSIDEISITADTYFIVASQMIYSEIILQLQTLGVENDKIYRYEGKIDVYYMALSPQYYEYEYRDLMSRYYGDTVWKLPMKSLRECDDKNLWKKIWR